MWIGARLDRRLSAWSLLLSMSAWAALGCTRSDEGRPAEPTAANAQESTALPPIPNEFAAEELAQPIVADTVEPALAADVNRSGPGQSVAPPPHASPPPISAFDERPDHPAPPVQESLAGRTLRDDLSLPELVAFLAAADADMELIHANRSGIEDPRELRETLLQIVNRKLQAAERLAQHAEATAEQVSEGNRGKLQALSHLAALSDVNAAERLERLANDNMSSADPRLVAESRLVLIGFAIESLQNGDEGAPQKIVEYVDQIAASGSTSDVPALIVMGQAKEVLQNYGHQKLARQVRDSIIGTFADSTNPEIAGMAAQIAGNVRYDGVDQLRQQILDGAEVTSNQWIESVETLIDESADLQTVRYLAGAAVDFEASGRTDLAEATLTTLQDRFVNAEAATTAEIDVAIKATEARKQIIGKSFDPQLSSIAGQPLSLDQFRGKVVLMPFWGMEIPQSLQPIAALRSIRDRNPQQVAIVGLNLDPPDAPLRQFVAEHRLDFPSFHIGSAPSSTIPRDFGVVSFPFVAILDADGRVAAIELTGKGLAETVQQLVNRP